jgi:glutathione peroxidase
MRLIGLCLVLFSLVGCGRDGAVASETQPPGSERMVADGKGPRLEHKVKTLEGEPFDLASLRGRVLLIVNTASQCGYTPQYEGLETLYDRYRERGFEVLAFPCNDFGGQEPGDAKTIREYLAKTFQVSFPVFEKQRIKGKSADKSPLWRTLTEELPEGLRGEVRWNFTKFLVNAEGMVVARYESSVDPLDSEVTSRIESLLPRK